MAILTNFDEIATFDKAFSPLGRVTAPADVDMSVKLNGRGLLKLTLLAADPNVADLIVPGARVRVKYRGLYELSGMVDQESGQILPNGNVVFTIPSDWRMLQDTVARVVPSNSLAASSLSATSATGMGQSSIKGATGADGTTDGQYGYYVWPSGVTAAETLVKRIVADNFQRASLMPYRPVSILPTQSRGGDAVAAGVLPMVRMSTLEEATATLLAWSGLVLELQHRDAGLVELDTRVPSTWKAPLTTASGIITGGSWSKQGPSVTRSIVGGPGEDVARAFADVKDATGLEDLYGYAIEVFRDATGATLNWPSTLAEAYRVAKYYLLRPEVADADKTTFTNYLLAAGAKGLTEGLPISSVSAQLTETPAFHYGGTDGVRLGDYVTVKVASGELFTNRITEARFKLGMGGVTVTPILGEITDDPDRNLANAIAMLAASARRLSTSR